ncbi:glycosyltransferase [Parabacteroides sp. OttesenSCG-928-G07]|nr:glycosyltransferase [Parabacteroides sp. OttesenSCG-928-G21]MDL2278071.1 glycosyltransferase [Parabacteroides sp. OttesenSCG-928-G07]
MKKILFIIPSLKGGGAERVLINLLQKIDFNKYQVDLCVGVKKGEYLNEIPKGVNNVIYLFKRSIWEKLFISLLYRDLEINFFYKRRILSKLSQGYDVGVSFLDSAWSDILLFKNNIKKKIVWIHSSYSTNSNFYKYTQGRYKQKRMERYSKMDSIVFVSNEAKEDFVSIYGQSYKMEVIYNMISPSEVVQKSKEPLRISQKQSIQFIAVGSLLPVKGYDRLLRVSKKLKEDGLNFHVSILGKGHLQKSFVKMINDMDITEAISLEGFKSNPYPYIKQADVFIMTSVSEALPTVLCEAMILEKPVIVTNCCGCREIVDNGQFGIMVEQNDEMLYKAMKEMILNKATREKYSQLSKLRATLFNDKEVLSKIDYIFA